jgi:dihydrofolate synthase/folylpolyglutamate synthase
MAIVETGLGGRLDSTNIIRPMLSVITNISLDHQNILGDTLPEIACEKAGIIKPNIPVVVGRKQPEIAAIFEQKAAAENAPLYFADDIIAPPPPKGETCFVDKAHPPPKGGSRFIDNYLCIEYSEIYPQKSLVIRDSPLWGAGGLVIKTDLNAVYQIENIKTALAAMYVFSQYYDKIPFAAVAKGLRHVRRQTNFNGRWQVIHNKPKTVVDVGHNEDGILHILKQLERETYRTLHIIYGAVKDKDVGKIFKLLPPNAQYYLTEPNIARKMPVEELQTIAEQYHLQNKIYKNTAAALEAANQQATDDDLILIVGSFFILEDIISNVEN